MFEPNFRLTGRVARALMSIEADRQIVAQLPLTAPLLDSLRRTARVLSTHFSTQIEGNQLSPAQVQAVVEGAGNFPGRERDEAEVRHYFDALAFVESRTASRLALTETEIRTIHGLVMTGKAKPTPYRDGQNVVRDSQTGRIVYMPPEAKDVASLMKDLVRWVNASIAAAEIPIPVVAALAHYQFATIHPYFDGNGRTARLLTNLLLHRNGYGLNGIYSLDEYYAANLTQYYAGLAVGTSHNDYFGRAEGDVTPFVSYFCLGMAEAFAKVRTQAETASRQQATDQSSDLRRLSPQQRQVLGLFLRSREVTRNDIAAYFQLPRRQAYLLCARWIKAQFLVVANPSTKARSYRLADEYEHLVSATAKPARKNRRR
ncbi:MAG: Fic family protein [Planctomycetes bacterium]|nr:Fic family protein [Planctomycetota bacterium]